MKKSSTVFAGLLFLGVASLTAAEDRKERVLNDRKEVEASGNWIDPKEKTKVTSVAAGSPAEKAAFKAGDEILSLEGQPVLSMADVQCCLTLGSGSLVFRR